MKEEGKLGLMRWTSIFLGIAGSYGQNDSVDIAYEVDGRKVVAAKLPLEPARRRRTAHDGYEHEPGEADRVAVAVLVLAAALRRERDGAGSARAFEPGAPGRLERVPLVLRATTTRRSIRKPASRAAASELLEPRQLADRRERRSEGAAAQNAVAEEHAASGRHALPQRLEGGP